MPADARRANPPTDEMTIEAYLAFTETRPREERWELIEGRPVIGPSPTLWHQQIAANICVSLTKLRDQHDLPWIALLGTGTIVPVSPRSLPQPDVMVLPGIVEEGDTHYTDDVLILFEVLSRSNRRADQLWRRRVYASIPNCQHYVTIEQRRLAVTRYDRADGWKGTVRKSLDGKLELAGLGKDIAIPLREIYRFTPLGG